MPRNGAPSGNSAMQNFYGMLDLLSVRSVSNRRLANGVQSDHSKLPCGVIRSRSRGCKVAIANLCGPRPWHCP